ncbi:MAG TPA: PP2C family protein-serine/threonine phosphatase, partial [Blastocatellia bacterium]|nr:PP2C family protein-serine/threonine phosphatase [Blastocatellia bacterium]
GAPGIALGCASPATFKSTTRAETVSVAPGDLVLLYTDGVTEAMDLNSDEYGEARLIALAKRLSISGATAAAVIDTILADVNAFVGRAPQHDDITLVAIRVAGP